MKKYLFSILLIVYSLLTIAQTNYKGSVIYGDSLLPKLIQFDESLPRSTNAQQILQDNLSMTATDSVVKISEITDKLGRLHEKYQQYYNGIKVNGGIYNVHYTLAGKTTKANNG